MTTSTTELHQIAAREALRLVSQLGANIRDDFANDVFQTLTNLGFEVRLRAASEVGGRCSIDGSYQRSPPRITLANNVSSGRIAFSGGHEFGHDLVRKDGAIHDLFDRYSEEEETLEELICDAVAAELLLPSDAVDRCLALGNPTAAGVVGLFQTTQASREAACVRAAQRITTSGYVMLAQAGTAIFTAVAGLPYRVARDTYQGQAHGVGIAEESGRRRGRESVIFRSGKSSPLYYFDATEADGYVFAVFLSAKAPWVALSNDPKEWGRSVYRGTCGSCAKSFETNEKCWKCHTPICPLCGFCGGCPATVARVERTCEGCWLKRAGSQFVDESGLCTDCRDS